MAGKEVREYTNLTDPRDKKLGKMQEVAGERGGYLHGRGALDSDDLLYLKEQMEAEEDAERLLNRTEKLAFADFKISFYSPQVLLSDDEESLMQNSAIDIFSLTAKHKAVAETSPASVPLPLRVEPKPKSGIRQQDLLKRVVEVKPKRQRVSSPSDGKQSSVILNGQEFGKRESVSEQEKEKEKNPFTGFNQVGEERNVDNPVKSLLAAYESSDDEY